MKGRESYKMRWDDKTEEFVVRVLFNDGFGYEQRFHFIGDAFEYIAEDMGMSQIAGENWTFTYERNE